MASSVSRQDHAHGFAFTTSKSATRLGALDVLGMAILVAVLLVLSFIQSRHRIFWSDEIMGVYVLRAGSWASFLERWRAGIDSSGFWFYIFAKPWESLFGLSELSLRMYSAAGVCASAVLIWTIARRFYSLPVVAVSTGLLYLDVGTLRWQLSNARSYGLLMAFSALVLFLIMLGEDLHRRASPLFLLATFMAYNMLSGSHILGSLYAAGLLATQVGIDLHARRWRPSLYGAAASGIVAMVLFSLDNLRSTIALGKPVFWTVRPSLRDLLLRTDFTSGPVRTICFVLFLVTLLQLRQRSERWPIYGVLCGFVGLDLFAFFISQLSTSIYVDRYLLPFTLALILLCAELLTQLGEVSFPYPRLLAAAPILVALFGIAKSLPPHFFFLPLQDYTGKLLASLPAGLPIVNTDVGSFVDVEYYHHGQFTQPFIFPLDTAVTTDASNPGGVSGFKEMDNFYRLGLTKPDLQPTEAILSRYPDMLVITGFQSNTWFKRRILDSDRYTVRDLGDLPGLTSAQPRHLWEARRR